MSVGKHDWSGLKALNDVFSFFHTPFKDQLRKNIGRKNVKICEHLQNHWEQFLNMKELLVQNFKTLIDNSTSCFPKPNLFRKLNWSVVSTPLKNISQNGNLPQIGVKIKKYVSCHHPLTNQTPITNFGQNNSLQDAWHQPKLHALLLMEEILHQLVAGIS